MYFPRKNIIRIFDQASIKSEAGSYIRYEWSYGTSINGLKDGLPWGYNLLVGVITPFVTGRDPPCRGNMVPWFPPIIPNHSKLGWLFCVSCVNFVPIPLEPRQQGITPLFFLEGSHPKWTRIFAYIYIYMCLNEIIHYDFLLPRTFVNPFTNGPLRPKKTVQHSHLHVTQIRTETNRRWKTGPTTLVTNNFHRLFLVQGE